jgi:hypothetical protein
MFATSSIFLNSGSPVTIIAFLSWDKDAVKQSAYAID